MDSYIMDLSEDSLDFNSSLHINSEMEIYLSSSQMNNKSIKSNMENSVDKFELVQTGNCFTDNSGVNTVENSSTLFDLSTPSFSVNRLSFASEIKDLQNVLADINEQYIKWKTSKFLLDLFQFERNAPQHKEKEAWREVTVSTSHPIKYFKNKSGKTFNFLGLDNDSQFMPSEKSELHKYDIADIEKKAKQLIGQKKMFSDLLGSHSLKICTAESLLSEEQEQLAQLCKYTHSKLEQACQLVNNNNLILQQLAYLRSSPVCELMKTSYTSLKDKSSHLHNTTSILKYKVEQRLYQDKEQTKVGNDIGDNLRVTMKELNGQLKSLQKALHEYERKEEMSKAFKEIVVNYSRTQRQLQHKIQTLSVLNNPDNSF